MVTWVRCLELKLVLCHMESGKRTLHVAPRRPGLTSQWGKSVGPLCPLLPPQRVSEPGLSVIPQASRRKSCLKLWRGCTTPGGVLACPAASLLSQLKKTFLHRVRGKYPGQLEIGSSLRPTGDAVLRLWALGTVTAGLISALASPECLLSQRDCYWGDAEESVKLQTLVGVLVSGDRLHGFHQNLKGAKEEPYVYAIKVSRHPLRVQSIS